MVGGWIDELYADRVGQWVRKGEPLFTLYSPELFTAQEDYLVAFESQQRAGRVGSNLRTDYELEARRQRLLLFDLGSSQIERLEETGVTVERVEIPSPASGFVIEKNVVAGAAVSPGMRLLRIAGLDRVWVEAEVYESELGLLSVGDAATVTLRHLPGRSFEGKIGFIYPWLDDATRTGRVRIELPNRDLALKPEMYAEVVFEPDLGERLAVAEEAILYAGDRRYVFLDLGSGRLRPQAVTLGQRAGEWVEVLDGLTAGDQVVTSGNFLIAAEARLKLALDHWTPSENGAAPSENGAAPAPLDGDHPAHAADPGGHGAEAEPAVEPAEPADDAGHAGHGAPEPAADPAGHAGHGDHGAEGSSTDHAGHGAPEPAADPTDPGAAADHADHAGHGDPAAQPEHRH
jgi:RND family efflux transporter MFP subunit